MLNPEQLKALQTVQSLMWAAPEIRQLVESEFRLSIDPVTFYSGIPSLEEIKQSFEYSAEGTALPVLGAEFFNLEDEVARLQELQKFAPADLSCICEDTGFSWENNQFSHSDALNLFLFLRAMDIGNVVEVGCGWSSRIISSVLQSNDGIFTCIDPSPRAEMGELKANFIQERIQDQDPQNILNSLDAGDLLFIDSSHTLKSGSDCLYLYTRIVPYLKTGVFVHIHDLYLPYPRPISKLLLERQFWHEDYAVLLLMIGNVLTPILSNYLLASQPITRDLMLSPPCGKSKGGASIFFRKL